MVIYIGVKKIIDARWTCIFELTIKQKATTNIEEIKTAHILFYGSNCREGYNGNYPEVNLLEADLDGEKRIVTQLEFEDKTYDVENPRFIFDYGAYNK